MMVGKNIVATPRATGGQDKLECEEDEEEEEEMTGKENN
jgi:hypothetical protein